MTQNTFSDTASIGEDFIQHYGVKGMRWGVRNENKEPKREYNKVVSTNEDGSREIYVGGVGTAGRLLDEEEQKRADELAELLPQLDSDYEKTNSEYEELYSEYEKLDEASKALSENDPKYEAAASKASEAWARSSEVRKKRDKLSSERVKYRTEFIELRSKAMALEKKERENNPGSGRRAVVMPEPGKTTYTSRPDPAGVDDARFKKVKHFDDSEYLEHYGVKGMKWGVRRDLKKLPTKKAREAYVAEKDAKWRAKTEDPKKAVRAAKRASRDATRMTRKLNKKYKDMGYKLKGNSLRKNNINNRKNRLVRNQYDIELKGIIESSLDSAAYKVYKNSPSRLYQVNLSRDLDGTVSAKIAPRQNAKLDKQRASITNKARKMKHSDEGAQDLYVKMEEDEDGFVVDIQLPEFDLEFAEDEVSLDHSDLSDLGSDFLQHYGVKGMKWGVRKDKQGKVKSVVKRTPLRGVDESEWNGAVRSIRKQNDPELEASLKRVKQTYKTSKESINQGLRNINKLYEGVDLNTAPKRVRDEYYNEVNSKINEKLTANTILNSRPKDRLVPLFDYDVKKGGAPDVSFVSNYGFSSGAARASATRSRDSDMNTLDHGKRLAKRISKRMALVYITGGLVRSGFEFGEGVNAGLDAYQRMRHDGMGDVKLPRLDVGFDIDVDEFGKVTNVEFEVLNKDVSHVDADTDFLQHYGVKGMKWGVRKDKQGKVTSVVRNTPLRGTNEYDGPNADGKAVAIKEYADPKVLTGLKSIYKDARVPINRGLKSLNKSDKYKDADLTDSKSKVFKDYHDDVSNLVKEKLYASTTLKLRDNDRFVIDHYDYDSREDSAPRIGTVVSTVYTPERRTPDSKEFADSVKYRHNTRLNDITDAAKSDGLKYIATGALSTALGQPPAIGPLLVGVTSTAYKVDSRREKSEQANEYMKSRKVRHSGLDENADPQDFILSFGYARNGFIEDVKMEVKSMDVKHSDLIELGSDFLMHHGVKGMKWGVRKDGKPRGYQGPSSTKKKVKKAVSNVVDPDKRAKRKLKKAKAKYERQRLIEQASGYEKATKESEKNSRKNEKTSDPSPKPKSKSVAELSDDELRKVIQRIDLEKRYATLMEERRPKSTTEKVNKFMKKAATEAASNVTKQLMNQVAGAAVTRATGIKLNNANTKAATNALKDAANDAAKDVAKAAQNQADAQPKAPSQPTPKANAATKPPTKSPIKSPTKSPSFSDILSKSYNDTITSGTTQKGNSWLDEFDTNRDFVTLNVERRKRR